jgi:hypothetical protein
MVLEDPAGHGSCIVRSAGARWDRRLLPGTTVGDDVVAAKGLVVGRELEDPFEDHAATA